MSDLAASLATPVYTMNVETEAGVKPHGFHLGTMLCVAEEFVMEQLRKPEVKSVALYLGDKPHRIYDWRDLIANAF